MVIQSVHIKPNSFTEVSFHTSLFNIEVQKIHGKNIVFRFNPGEGESYIKDGTTGQFETAGRRKNFVINSVKKENGLLSVNCSLVNKLMLKTEVA